MTTSEKLWQTRNERVRYLIEELAGWVDSDKACSIQEIAAAIAHRLNGPHELDEMAEKLAREVPATHMYYYQELTRAAKHALTQAYNQAIEDAKNAIKSKQIQLHEQTRSYVVDVLDQLKKETK